MVKQHKQKLTRVCITYTEWLVYVYTKPNIVFQIPGSGEINVLE